MPTYEYVCKNCGDNFDVHQSFSDKPLKKHDTCGGELQKVFHARGIVFKGGGFYATDSTKPEKTPSKKGDKKDAKKSDSKSDSKSKTKEKAKSTSSSSDRS
jgi:putative FmdB family regulatory protein